MSGAGRKSESQSGSALGHLVVLMALALVCYFGVKAFYSRFDSAAIGTRDLPPRPAASDTTATAQAGYASAEPDKEAITRRNLFLPVSRQSDSVKPNGQVQGGDALEPDLLLVGTVVDSGGGNRAVILDVEEKKQLLLREGEMVNGASIRQILAGKVIISREGRNELLDIAESAKIQAVLAGQASTAAAPSLQIDSATPESTTPELVDDGAENGQRIDLNRLDDSDGRVILKGRLNNNI